MSTPQAAVIARDRYEQLLIQCGRPVDSALAACILGVTDRHVRRIMDDLVSKGLARELPPATGAGPGRPRRIWEISPPPDRR